MRKLFYVNCFISIVFTAAAQERIADPRITFANTITAEELKEHLYILASEKLEGREAGEQGQKLAAEYMRNYFESIGIPPVPAFNSYYQTFDLWQSGWGEMYMTAGENKYTFIRDFYAYPNSGKAADINTNEVLFLGYGIDDTMYSDYANVDVKDKVILVLKGEPVMNGRSVITGTGDLSAWSSDWKRKIEMATEKGVKAILLVDDNIDKVVTNKYLVEYLRGTSLKLPADVKPVTYCSYAFISPQIANDLFSAKKLEKAKRKIANATPAHFTAKTNLHYTFEKIEQIITTENVLAYIEGGELKEELIVVSAHYDHLGIHGDAIYYGADDDGSGTVGLLELAEAMMEAKKAGFTLKRSVLFIGFTAEEKGLYGSEYYASDPVFPLAQTVANLNIDMIGRVDDAHIADTNYIYIIGSDFLSTELHEINEYNAKTYTALNLDYRYNSNDDPNRFYYRSDHYHFAKNNIPVIFFFNGTHADYHQPTDTPDKIHYPLLAERSKLVFHNIWSLANMERRIVVDVVE